MVRIASRAPLARRTLTNIFLRLSANGEITPSVYGPILQTRQHDLTFRFCVQGAYGRYFSNFLSDQAKPFSFIDIGANIGLFSLIAAANPNCHRCYAFEPNPEIFRSLERNIALNGHSKIRPYNAAVSATSGPAAFSAHSGHSGAGALDAAGTITVMSLNRSALDNIAKCDALPKIVKIDVEGHEPVVLSELLNSGLAPQVRNVYFEVQETKYEVASVIASLNAAGLFEVYKDEHNLFYDLMFERKMPLG
jgi:FkbM family methyltransferase